MSGYVPTPSIASLPPLPADAPTVVSTFAGTGGSSLGYRLAGYKMRLAVEWDDCAADCYRANYPDTPLFHGDITKLSGEDALRLSDLRPGELDVFDGSPPCQGFSTAGKRDMGDSRNQLFREYVRLLRAFQPRALVMENVSGMVKGKMAHIFVEILRELKASGYRVKAQLLNAMYFGVPQMRQRMIFIGVREDLGVEPTHPRARTRVIPIREVLPSLTGAEQTTRHPAPPPLADRYGELWSSIKPGGSAADLLDGSGFGSRKMNPDKPCNTLMKMTRGTGFATFMHPTIPRALTIEEALIIGGFPEDFRLEGDYPERWARIGNSVPPPLIQAVAEHIRKHILEVT